MRADTRVAPNANAYAERFVRSTKEECLDRLIPIVERHFRCDVREYVEHDHGERNRQGLHNALLAGVPEIGTAAEFIDDHVRWGA